MITSLSNVPGDVDVRDLQEDEPNGRPMYQVAQQEPILGQR
jgi:hypothetical protein